MLQRKDSGTQLVTSAPDSRTGRREIGRDFFSNIGSDLNGIAAQTTSMFSDLFGKPLIIFLLDLVFFPLLIFFVDLFSHLFAHLVVCL